jgi:hypothetical protein
MAANGKLSSHIRQLAREVRRLCRSFVGKNLLERAAGIEPARLAWKARALPLHHARAAKSGKDRAKKGQAGPQRARSGTGCTRSCRRARATREPDPRADAGAAEGAALRPRRRGVFADAHAQGWQTLPLLRKPDGAEAWRRIVPRRPRACGRNRSRRRRPAAGRFPPARDRGRHVEGGARPCRRHH